METSMNGLDCFEYNLLKQYPHVAHGSFGRSGGVSGPRVSKNSRNAVEKNTGALAVIEQCGYGSLNLGEGTADQLSSIHANRAIVRKALDVEKIIFPQQNHGASVQRITSKNMHQIAQVDALFTTEKNIGIGVTHADCQGAIFYDPLHEAVGVVHCGWRGNVQNIYSRLIDSMQREIGTKPHHLIVCISPSLGKCCSEFVNYKQELPKDFWAFKGDKPLHFDLKEVTRWQLNKCGVLDKNIEFAQSDEEPICSHCAPNYFSYRRDKDMSGRNATIVALRNH
jgi:YfiH family protein